jgi:ketosteroid isomerase-like protein
MPTDLDAKLRVVIDKQEIHEVIMRYCRGIDRGDVPLVLSTFHEDAIDNHVGIEEIAHKQIPAALELAKTAVIWTMHSILNELVEVDGDVAMSESYFVAYHRMAYDGREVDWTLGGRYMDRMERRNGEWKIAYRTVIHDWSRFDDVATPPANLMQVGYLAKSHQGTRSKADLSYKFLS